jgi:DNA-binding NarL/FixJ family response regulator
MNLEINESDRRDTPLARVLIVAPDVMTGEFITKTLSNNAPQFESNISIGNASAVLADIGTFNPHFTLLSQELQEGPEEGFKVLRELQRSHPGAAVVMLLKRPDPDCVISAFRFGAQGILYRSHSLKSLPKCIQTVLEGQIWITNQDLKHILDWLRRVNTVLINGADGLPLLTSREQDVVRLVADGMKNREIAQSLRLTEHSVRNYLYRILDKLGVSSRVELILYALSRRN